jgi:glycosyltransferase involved in cell wall biosynthesis
MGESQAEMDRVYLLVSSPDAPGGIARVVARLANELVASRPVEVIGLRRLKVRAYPLDDRIKVTYVVDAPTGVARWVDSLPSLRAGMNKRQGQSALVDILLPRVLRTLGPGVVMSTRPLLHVAAARYAPRHCILVGQDHGNLEFREANASLRHVARAIDRLDRFVVLTEADAESYRARYPKAADRIQVIRNAAPWPVLDRPTQRRPVIVAAGQLGKRKGFDRLIDAFAPIAEQRPKWQVHIYGDGVRRRELAQQISDRGLRGRVILKGRTRNMEQVLEEAGVFALTSRNEGLPMVLIEAMTKGVPVVSFDCPRGPAEIVDDFVTGRLVDNGDIEGFTAALLALMDDPDLREQMSRHALERAERYQLEKIMQSWNSLLDSVIAERLG